MIPVIVLVSMVAFCAGVVGLLAAWAFDDEEDEER